MAEVRQRILSGGILAAAVVFITWWNPVSFALLCLLGGAILAREWWTLTKQRGRGFILLGILYIGGAVASLIYLRATDVRLIYFLFALVWTGDIAAYVTGKLIGRHKIAPRISPGKTWEGWLGAGFATSAALFWIGNFDFDPRWITLVYGFFIASLGLLGDLFESSLKRHAGVKDSGSLIPGHGGLFDRVDALMPCAIAAAFIIAIFSYLLTDQPF